MKFRKLNRAEHERTRSLYEEVFSQDEKPFVDYYYSHKTRDNEIYVAEDPSGIHAMVHVNPVTVNWQGEQLTVPYLVAVSTQETYRHQGLMRELLTLSLSEHRRRGTPFVFLMPASEAIYTPFGFHRTWPWRWEEDAVRETLQAGENASSDQSSCKEYKEEGLPEDPGFLKGEPVEKITARDSRICGEDILQAVSLRVNEMLGRTFSLFTVRSPAYYRNLAAEQEASGGCLQILFASGQPLCVRCTAKESFPPMMARILNLEEFLRRIRTEKRKTILCRIEDSLLKENSGIFQISLTSEGGRTSKQEEEPRFAAGMRESGGSVSFYQSEQKGTDIPLIQVGDLPGLLKENNPFARAFICEVV